MIINLKDIERLRKFILVKATDKELEICQTCCEIKENKQCMNKDICSKYTPIYENSYELIQDLFDTIEHLIERITNGK